MSKIYIPEEITFGGITYLAESVQEAPEELVNYINNHPRLSKLSPKAKRNKFSHFNREPLETINAQINEYKSVIEYYKKQVAIHQMMNTPLPSRLIPTLENNLKELAEFEAYVAPIIQEKELKEKERRAKIEALAKDRGTNITFHEGGRYSEHSKPKTIQL